MAFPSLSGRLGAVLVFVAIGCSGPEPNDPSSRDGGARVEDAGARDAGRDAGSNDAGRNDGGERDGGVRDGGRRAFGPSTFLISGGAHQTEGGRYRLRLRLGAPRPIGRSPLERTSR